MKKLFLLTTTLAIALMSYAGVQVNTVFSMAGNEKNASVTAEGTTNGVPEVTFKSTHITYEGDVAADPSFSKADYIKIPCKYSESLSPKGVNMMIGDLTNFTAPFGPVLDNIIADSIVWSFAIKYTYSDGVNGFGEGKRGIAVILAMDNSDPTTANGYALVGMGSKKFSFARFAEGLGASDNVTQKISTESYADYRTPSVFRIVYQPSEHRWTMYYAMSSTTSDYLDPATATYTYVGTCVDQTFTGKTMTSFGFYNCYLAPKKNYTNLSIRNYSVKTYFNAPVQSNIYNTTYNADSKTMMNGCSKGTPAVTYTHTPITVAGTAPNEPYCQNGLTIGKPTSSSEDQGRNILTASIANFAAPFTSKLSEIKADSIAWAFNMRNNREFASTGLNDGYNGYAVALVASDADLTKGCGYALVMGDKAGTDGKSTKKYRLVRYDNGLIANSNTTKIVLSDAIELRSYTTVRIVYIPSTNKWKLYTYANETEFVKPDECIYTYHGVAADNTYTSTDMTTFGFMVNYIGKNAGALFIKNFSLSAYYKQDIISEELNNSAVLDAKDGLTVNIELHRNLKKDTWNTICLPFDMTSDQIREAFGADCQLAQLSSATMEDETLILDFDDNLSSIEAGIPYLIQPKKNVTAPVTVFDVTLNKSAQTIDKGLAAMVGVFSPTTLEVSKNTLFLGAENTLYYVSEESDLPGLRAYFTLTDAAAKAPKHCVKIGRVPTDINVLPSMVNTPATKHIVNGQLIIEREGVPYNAQGIRLQ